MVVSLCMRAVLVMPGRSRSVSARPPGHARQLDRVTAGLEAGKVPREFVVVRPAAILGSSSPNLFLQPMGPSGD